MRTQTLIACSAISALLLSGCVKSGACVRPPPPAHQAPTVPAWALDKTDYALKGCEVFFDTSTCSNLKETYSKPPTQQP